MGKNLIYVPQCHSTNTLAADLSQNGKGNEGTVVITNDQTAGRGQRGNTWETAAGQNFTFSVILHPRFLAVKDQFYINRVVSLAIADFARDRGAADVRIKWPNDIMIGERKICGILIENHLRASAIHHAVVGIGLNINQLAFHHPRAGSLGMATGVSYDLRNELPVLLGFLEARYLELKAGRISSLENDYLNLLYRINEIHTFMTSGKMWSGVITGVDEVGRLRIETDGAEKTFDIKEVQFL